MTLILLNIMNILFEGSVFSDALIIISSMINTDINNLLDSKLNTLYFLSADLV